MYPVVQTFCRRPRKWWPLAGYTASIALGMVLLIGCGQSSSGWGGRAPSGDIPRDRANALATLVAMGEKGISASVSATGSMLPWMDEKCVIVLTMPKTPVRVGDIVLFDRADTKNVLHRVVDANANSLYLAGDNNQYADGWYPRSAVKYRLSAVFYTGG